MTTLILSPRSVCDTTSKWPSLVRLASREAVLLVGVIGIGESQGQRFPKDGGRFLEGDTMLGQVAHSALSTSFQEKMY